MGDCRHTRRATRCRLQSKSDRSDSLLSIGLATVLAPAATSLGHLAMPLAILRGFANPKAALRAKFAVAAHCDSEARWRTCWLASSGAERLSPRLDNTTQGWLTLWRASATRSTVPGRLLWPSAFGVPASWCAAALPSWLSWGSGILALLIVAALAVWHRARWNRRLVLVGAAMIYLGYGLTYMARAGLVTRGRWTEAQLIYRYATRYHVLPLIGLAAVLAAVLAAWRPIRRCDARRGLPALVGAVVGLTMLAVQRHEVNTWCWLLGYSDQRPTLAALDHVRRVACEEGITRAQLARIVAPALRPWNAPLLTDTPASFSLMKLVEAPIQVSRARSDHDARILLSSRLTYARASRFGIRRMRIAQSWPPGRRRSRGLDRPVSRAPEHSRRPTGRYRSNLVPGSIKFAFDPANEPRFLVLPGLEADQDLIIFLCDIKGRSLEGRSIRWLHAPRADGPAVVELESIIHWWREPVSQITVQLTRPGEIALDAPPRLLR